MEASFLRRATDAYKKYESMASMRSHGSLLPNRDLHLLMSFSFLLASLGLVRQVRFKDSSQKIKLVEEEFEMRITEEFCREQKLNRGELSDIIREYKNRFSDSNPQIKGQ